MSYQDITLTSGATTVTIPGDQMVWTDRRSRNLVAQNIEIAANGAAIIEEFQQIGTYPITLVATGINKVTRDTVNQLLALCDAPLTAPMTLVYNDGTVLSVRWNFFQNGGSGSNAAVVDAATVFPTFPESDADLCTLTLRLIQASA